MTPADELEADLKAVWAELWPRRQEKQVFDDEIIALGVQLRRDIQSALRTRVIEPAYAEGAEPQPNVKRSSKRRIPE